MTARRTRRPLLLAPAGIALVGSILVGCSSGGPPAARAGSASVPTGAHTATNSRPSSPTPTEATGTACGLVTVAEVTTAAGTPMAVSGDGGAICSFSATGDPSTVLYLQTYADVPSMSLMKQTETAGSDHIAGLGDDAFWNSTARTVFVRTGNRGLSITLPSLAALGSTEPDALKTPLVTLATTALAHL
jgi:hypothetical protein